MSKEIKEETIEELTNEVDDRALMRALLTTVEAKMGYVEKVLRSPQVQKKTIIKVSTEGYLKALTEVYYACHILLGNGTEDKTEGETSEESN